MLDIVHHAVALPAAVDDDPTHLFGHKDMTSSSLVRLALPLLRLRSAPRVACSAFVPLPPRSSRTRHEGRKRARSGTSSDTSGFCRGPTASAATFAVSPSDLR